MDLSKLSLVELKALGFDTQNIIAIQQQNLQVIVQELDKRNSMPAPIPGQGSEAPVEVEPIKEDVSPEASVFQKPEATVEPEAV